MKNYILTFLFFILSVSTFAQKTVKELKSIKESKTESEFYDSFFINTNKFTISAISDQIVLQKIEDTAKLYGIDLKIKPIIRSNKIYELTFEIKKGNDTNIENFKNGIMPLNKIEIEFYKNSNPEINESERKTTFTIKKDRNNIQNGNEARVLFSE